MAKSILPVLLWVSLIWFLYTGRVVLPVYGLVKREEETLLYVFLMFLNLAVAASFTGMLVQGA